MNSFKFKDVAHLYIGCFMYDRNIELTLARAKKTYTPSTLRMTDGKIFWLGSQSDSRHFDETNYKPLLKNIKDITQEDCDVYNKIHLTQHSIEELINQVNQEAVATKYLIAKGYDLFGLIDSGEAYDMEEIKLSNAGVKFPVQAQKTPDMEYLYNCMGEFSVRVFHDANTIDHLKKLKEEVDELIENPGDLHEYADCILALFGAAYKMNIPYKTLANAVKEKFDILLKRKWEKRPDGTYQHVKN